MISTVLSHTSNDKSSILVVHIITTIDLGGAEKQLLILVNEQLKRGLKVMVIPLKGKTTLEKDFLDLGCTVYSKITNQLVLCQILRINKFLKKHENYILHAHLPRAEMISRLLASHSRKLIVSRHNAEQFFPGLPLYLSSWISRYVLKKADAIIAISNAVKHYLLNSRDAKDSMPICVVPYGINNKPTKIAKTGKIKATKKIYKIGTVARLVKQKNLETLILSFARYKFLYPNSKLVIIGEGNQQPYLFNLTKELMISESIIWMKSIKNVDQVLKSIDLFVLPSLYEGFGLVYLEAMQANIPIISSDNQAALEIFGKNAENLFEMKNIDSLVSKMIEFRSSSVRQKNLQRYKIILDRYSAKIMEENIFKIYISEEEQ